MRALLVFTLVTASLAGCASDAPIETADVPETPVLQTDVGGLEIDDATATAWIGEYAAGPRSVGAFSFTVPNNTIDWNGEQRIGLEVAPILPDGATLAHGYIHLMSEEGTHYHTVMDGVTIRVRGSPPSLPGSGASQPYDGSMGMLLPTDLAGKSATLVVGLDTGAGVGGIAVRTITDSDDRSDDAKGLLKKVNGTIGVLKPTGTSTGFATHLYADINIFLGILNLGIELWTTSSDYQETLPADLRPAVSVQDFSFTGSYDGAQGTTTAQLVHSGSAAVGTWSLSGDVHGQSVDEGSTLTGSAIPRQDLEGDGDGGATLTYSFQGAKATTVAEILIFQMVSRNHDFAAAQPVEPTGNTTNATVVLLDDLHIQTPHGTTILAGTGDLIRAMAREL